MPIVAASAIQKNFGEWHDKAFEGPIEITKYGRTTAYLISAKLFEEMWASYSSHHPTDETQSDAHTMTQE